MHIVLVRFLECYGIAKSHGCQGEEQAPLFSGELQIKDGPCSTIISEAQQMQGHVKGPACMFQVLDYEVVMGGYFIV
jgi:uncharacterized ferredoxin-like protein